jgi:hypothetical protein
MIWPFLNSRGDISAYSDDDPIKILAHNLDYWVPHITTLIEKRLRANKRIDFNDAAHKKEIENVRKKALDNITIELPLKGCLLWEGEGEVKRILAELVEIADKNGNLRAIIDAVKSNRVIEDFSQKWSFEKEDFERKIFRKRNKYKVQFVELTGSIPVHGPCSETEDNNIWEDFITILDQKERNIIVLISNGYTKMKDISQVLGYANHSPVSKALKKIRKKAIDFIDKS